MGASNGSAPFGLGGLIPGCCETKLSAPHIALQNYSGRGSGRACPHSCKLTSLSVRRSWWSERVDVTCSAEVWSCSSNVNSSALTRDARTQCSTLWLEAYRSAFSIHCVLPCDVNAVIMCSGSLYLGLYLWHYPRADLAHCDAAKAFEPIMGNEGVFLTLMPKSGFNSAPRCSGELSMLYGTDMGAR